MKKTKSRAICVWSPYKTMGGGILWRTSCGNGAKEAFKYCPHCGGTLFKEREAVVERQQSLVDSEPD